MNLEQIKKLPVSYSDGDFENSGRVHESIFKSYHILEQVLKLVERGVDKETIKEIVEYLRN